MIPFLRMSREINLLSQNLAAARATRGDREDLGGRLKGARDMIRPRIPSSHRVGGGPTVPVVCVMLCVVRGLCGSTKANTAELLINSAASPLGELI